MNNTKRNFSVHNKSSVSFIYAVPFLIIMFAFSMSLVKKGGNKIPSGQLAFLSDPINLIILGTAYIIASLLFCINFSILYKLLKGVRLYLFSIFFALSSVLVSYYPVKVVTNFGHYLGMTLSIILFVYYLNVDTKKMFYIFLLYAFIIINTSIVTSIFFPSLGISPIFGLWEGLTSNPNNLGTISFLSIWIGLFSLFFSTTKFFKLIAYLTIAGAGLCLYKSNSLTSSICSVFVLSAGPVLISTEFNRAGIIFLKIFFLFFAFCLFISIINAFFPEKLGLNHFFNFLGRDSTLSGRTSLWTSGIQAFMKKPIFGWGYDSNASILSRSVISFGQFHNGYLNLAIAGGALGLSLLIGLILKLYFFCFKLKKNDFKTAVAFAVLISAILLYNIAEAAFFNPTNMIWLFFVFSLYYLSQSLSVYRNRKATF